MGLLLRVQEQSGRVGVSQTDREQTGVDVGRRV